MSKSVFLGILLSALTPVLLQGQISSTATPTASTTTASAVKPLDPGRLTPENANVRVYGVVPIVGSGTIADPRRPMFAPAPPTATAPLERTGIIAYQFQESDDGNSALVGFVAVQRIGLASILTSALPNVIFFERGKYSRQQIASVFQKYKKSFSFNNFMPVRAMRALSVVLLAGFAAPLFGQYSYYFTDPMQSFQTADWTASNTPQFASYNGYSGAYGSGNINAYTSMVSTVPVPDGTSSYSVSATLHFPNGNDGGPMSLLLHSSSTFSTNGGPTQAYIVQLSYSGYPTSSYLQVSKVVNTNVTNISGFVANSSATTSGWMSWSQFYAAIPKRL